MELEKSLRSEIVSAGPSQLRILYTGAPPVRIRRERHPWAAAWPCAIALRVLRPRGVSTHLGKSSRVFPYLSNRHNYLSSPIAIPRCQLANACVQLAAELHNLWAECVASAVLPAGQSMLNRTDLRDQGHGSHARWLSLPKRESRPFWISGCLCDSRRLQSTSKNILLKSVGINSAARGVMPALPRLASAAKTPPAGPGLSPRIVWLHFPWILPAICVGPSTGAPCRAICARKAT